jgi:4-amino-4-deoxy-L-arabinose transferase-like glycosyltransferase
VRWFTLAAALAASFAFLWAAGMAGIHQAPPLDSAEQLAWSFSAEWGYWKHPPLPSWIVHAIAMPFGSSLELPFYATHVGNAVAMLLLCKLCSEWMGPARAILATGITALVGYHSWCADAYNHNAAMLPFQAATIACFWHAMRRDRWVFWIAAGVFAGLTMLVKYTAVLTFSGLVLYVLLDWRSLNRRTVGGMALCAMVAGAVLAPHVRWLTAHEWLPMRYAQSVTVPMASAADWLAAAGGFVATQVVRSVPLLLVVGWMAWVRRGSRGGSPGTPTPASDRLFMWTVGLAPLPMVLLSALVTGAEPAPRWGYNAFLLAGPMAVDLLRWPERRVWSALRICIGMHLVLWSATVLLVPRLGEAVGWQGRSTFPGRDLSQAARKTWEAETGRPLRIVVSETWLGGTLAAFHDRPLAVLAEGEWTHAPWIPPDQVRACGALVVLDRTEPLKNAFPAVRHWLEQADAVGEWQLDWVQSRRSPASRESTVSHIAWGVIAPRDEKLCRY